jgi:hypothetical protein
VLLRSVPKLVVYVPQNLHADRDGVVDIQLVCDRVTRITSVEAFVLGVQSWRVSEGSLSPANEMAGPRATVHLLGATTLPAGTTRVPLPMRLPAMPPTHEIAPASSRLLVTVTVTMPWLAERTWPTTRQTFALPVRAPAPATVIRTPVAARSVTARATDPRIEMALATTTLVAGELAVGSVAVYHVDDRRAREVTFAVQAVLKLHGRFQHRSVIVHRFSAALAIPPGSAGRSVPFTVRIPASTTPSFRAATHDLEWQLVASTAIGHFGQRADVAVPIEILDVAAIVIAPRVARPPRLGDERVDQVLAKFVSDSPGWRVVEPDTTDSADAAVACDVGDARLTIAHVYRGTDGTFLRASIAHPPLGIGLRGEPSKRRMVAADMRDGDHTEPVVAGTRAALASRLATLGAVVAWTETELAFELGVETLEVRTLATVADALAGVDIDYRRVRFAIPPPRGVDVDLDAWRALATRLHGELCVGDLSISGDVDGTPVRVGIAFDDSGAPESLAATAGSPERAGDALRAIAFDAPVPARSASLRVHADHDEALAAAARQLETWPPEVSYLSVADGVARARRPLPGDASRARELVDLLVGLLAALGPTTGPYR